MACLLAPDHLDASLSNKVTHTFISHYTNHWEAVLTVLVVVLGSGSSVANDGS
jgi:hypothetical protein